MIPFQDLISFDTLFPTFPDAATREVWCEWFRWHTIDPMLVRTDGVLIVDYKNYRISYPGIDLDADDFEVQRVIQLEAQPKPPPCNLFPWTLEPKD